MPRIGAWKTNKTVPVMAGVAAGITVAGVTAGVGFGVFQPTGVAANGAAVTLDALNGLRAGWAWAKSGVPFSEGDWVKWTQILNQYDLVGSVHSRVLLAGVSGCLGTVATMAAIAPFQERYRYGMRHVRGRILREGWHATKAAREHFAAEMKFQGNGPGLYLAQGVQMDRVRETEGMFILGAPGSGKTVWYRFLLDQIIKRGDHVSAMIKDGVPIDKVPMLPDKMIVVDVKGDQTERWPNEEFILFAPHDTGMRKGKGGIEKRLGYAWDIGKDIVGEPAARDFAARVIKATDEPVWGDAARGIFTGMLRGLQQEYDTEWGWRELYEVVSKKAKSLRAYLDKWDPVAAEFVQVGKTGPTRTSSSYLANITTGVVPVIKSLAAAWGDVPQRYRISLNEWVLDPNPEKRTIILQRSGRVREISSAWIRAVLFQLASFATSPDLSEDDRRRVWFMCDEAPQYLSKDDGFLEIIEVGRSKGYCAVVAAQVNKQFEKVWSPAEMETLESMMRTKVLFRTGGGAVADYLAEKVVGSSDWERLDVSTNFAESRTRTINRRVERELVVMPNYFDDRLGKTVLGIRFLWIGSKDVCRLIVPFPKNWGKKRAPTVTARWVTDNRFQFDVKRKDEDPEDGTTAEGRAPSGPGGAGGAVVIGGIPLPQRSGLGVVGLGGALGAGVGVGNSHQMSLLDRLAQAGSPSGGLGGFARGPTQGGGGGTQKALGGVGVQQQDDGGDDDEE